MLSVQKCLQRRFSYVLTKSWQRKISSTFIVNQRIDPLQSDLAENLDQKIYKLDEDVRRLGRVNKKDVTDIFKSIEKDRKATTSQGLLLIRCCGSLLCEETSQKRNQLVESIWNTLNEVDASLDISHYNALLKVYLDNEKKFVPTEFLTELQERGIEPNRVTYQRLMHRYAQEGNIDGATKILEFMKSKSMPISEAIFNSLILGYSRAGDLKSARETLGVMKDAGIEATNATYSSLLCALAEHVDKNADVVDQITQLIEEAERSDIVLGDRDKLEVIKVIAIKDEKSPLINSLINQLQKKTGYNTDCFNVIIDLINLKKLDVAKRLFHSLVKNQQVETEKNGGFFFVHQMVKAEVDRQIVIEFCEDLKARGINEYAMSKATESALLHCDVQTTEFYLSKLKESKEVPMRAHYYWPLLVKCKNEDELVAVLSGQMAELTDDLASHSAIHDTLTDWVWSKVENIDTFIQKCRAVGYPSSVLIGSLIDHSLFERKLKEVLRLVADERYSHVRLATRVLLGRLVNAYCATGEVNDCLSILSHLRKNSIVGSNKLDTNGKFLLGCNDHCDKQNIMKLIFAMKTSGLTISENIFNVLKERTEFTESELSDLKEMVADEIEVADDDDANVPVREMSLDELEQHLIELKSKGMNPNGVLRNIVFAYSRSRLLKTPEAVANARKRVEEVLRELQEGGDYLSNQVKSSVMDFYASQCNDLTQALEMKRGIAGIFQIDDYKVLNLAACCVKNGKVDEAFQLMKEENEKHLKYDRREVRKLNNSGERRVDRNIFRLLNAAAETTKDVEVVKRFFDEAIKLTDSAVSNIILGPLVKVHVLNNNLDKALEEFTSAFQKYRQTPWKGELIRQLIAKEDLSNLQSVTDSCISIHGEASTLIDLATAFLELGRFKQAKKIFDTPGLRIHPARLNFVCDRFYRDGKITELENFVSLSKGIFDANRDEMYYYLMRAYEQKNDHEKALNAWTSMQEDNVLPSQRTLNFLAEFLKKNSVNVPFAVSAY